jgi:hypothetical protein
MYPLLAAASSAATAATSLAYIGEYAQFVARISVKKPALYCCCIAAAAANISELRIAVYLLLQQFMQHC